MPTVSITSLIKSSISGYSGVSGYSGGGGGGSGVGVSGFSGVSGYSGIGGAGTSGFSGVSGYSGSTTTNNSWSVYFDGSGDYLTAATSSNFTFGTGDFTVECWINTPTAPGGGVTNDKLIFGSFAFTPTLFIALSNNNNIPILFNGTTTYTASAGVTANTWTHVAWVRNAGNLQIYINGTSVLTPTAFTTNYTASTEPYIGKSNADSTRNYIGFLSNLRVVKGTAVYTSNFTPPTAPLTIISGTSLLTCYLDVFTGVTAFGNTAISINNPFGDRSGISGYSGVSGYSGTVPTSVGNNGSTYSGTITPTGSSTQYELLGLNGPITIAAPSGSPIAGQRLMLRFKDAGSAVAITWTTSGGAYRAVGVTLPTTTVSSTNLYVGMIYNGTDNYWDVLSVNQQ